MHRLRVGSGRRARVAATWCDVLTISPSLTLPWRYTDEQIRSGVVWAFDEVHVCPEKNDGSLFEDVEAAVNILANDAVGTQYTLLVNPDGMTYDADRFGGDHQVRLPNGRMFTFSVRRTRAGASLLARVWN